MKYTQRYLLFRYSNYYPSGGLHDVDLAFDNFEEFENWYKENIDRLYGEYTELFDFEKREIIYEDKDTVDLDKVRELLKGDED
ncbi:hypothetical protein BSP38_132 [Bacillus phage BSP38]|uniref:Uncharacterized protein n=1 Tax=Bacillus phage BSP38 TaxID=2283013 RepID=A0A345MJZ2_BPBSP|nr:hypothetical protein HWB82_gp186 [Bacillus phage BSP38]AXH71174.1 hypothetical protein BSP38_132 [Bacillus phage BSP38]